MSETRNSSAVWANWS